MRFNIIILLLTAIFGFALTMYLDGSSLKSPDLKTDKKISGNLQTVPNFTVTDISGKKHNINDYLGREVVLHFWSTWCAPCVVEFPLLLTYAIKNPDTVILAISSDSDSKNIERFLGKQKPIPDNVIIIKDDQKITANLFQTFQLPESIMVNKNGQITQKIVGSHNWN